MNKIYFQKYGLHDTTVSFFRVTNESKDSFTLQPLKSKQITSGFIPSEEPECGEFKIVKSNIHRFDQWENKPIS